MASIYKLARFIRFARVLFTVAAIVAFVVYCANIYGTM
jgi:hypothetical protein